MHQFENAKAIIFCVSLSEFDQALRDDEYCNRLHESLYLFDEIALSRQWYATPIILFFTKKDIFEEKIKRGSKKGGIRICFADYKGKEDDLEESLNHIIYKFLEKASAGRNSKERKIQAYSLSMVDTDSVRIAFEDGIEKIFASFCIDTKEKKKK